MIERSGRLIVALAVFALIFCSANYLRAQADDSYQFDLRFLRSVALTPLLQHSTVKLLNNYYHTGKVYGVLDNDTIYLKDIGPVDTCEIETKDYTGIYLTWDFAEKETGTEVSKNYYFALSPKNPFTFTPYPVKQLTGTELIVNDKELRSLFGEKIYEVRITDEVNPNNIDVKPTAESSRYIELMKLDSSKWYVKLKSRKEFFAALSPEDLQKGKEGKAITLPVGIILSDRNVSSDKKEYRIFLKRERLKKSSS